MEYKKQYHSGVVPLQVMPSTAREHNVWWLQRWQCQPGEGCSKCWREPCNRKDADVKGDEISFYINIFIHYVDFMLNESYILSRISISTRNGFHQKVISLICIIPLLYFVSSIRIGTMFDMSSNLCLFSPFILYFILLP